MRVQRVCVCNMCLWLCVCDTCLWLCVCDMQWDCVFVTNACDCVFVTCSEIVCLWHMPVIVCLWHAVRLCVCDMCPWLCVTCSNIVGLWHMPMIVLCVCDMCPWLCVCDTCLDCPVSQWGWTGGSLDNLHQAEQVSQHLSGQQHVFERSHQTSPQPSSCPLPAAGWNAAPPTGGRWCRLQRRSTWWSSQR